MGNTIDDTLLTELSMYLVNRMGMSFTAERWPYLEQGLAMAATEFGFDNPVNFASWALTADLTRKQLGQLASHLTIGETYFWREKPSFEALQNRILPDLIRARQGNSQALRIWSAGCSTGEEPYSLTILLSQLIPDIANWDITILATDINPNSLREAAKGQYREWSFRGNTSEFREKYFLKKDGVYELLPQLKAMVTFAELNLAEDVYPNFFNNTTRMDLIFCRNVLMYFSPEVKSQVIERLSRSLVDGGWLVLSSSEVLDVRTPELSIVNFPGAVFYKRKFPVIRIPGINAPEVLNLPDVHRVNANTKDPNVNEADVIRFDNNSARVHSARASKVDAVQPNSKELYEQALTLYEQCRYEEIVTLLEQHVTVSGKSSYACQGMALLAKVKANMGKLADAEAWVKKAISCEKLNPNLHYFLATIFQEQEKVEEAAQSLQKALYLDHEFVLAHYMLGTLKKQQGKLGEANKHLDNALKILGKYRRDEVLPGSDGMTAGRLLEMISLTERRGLNGSS